MAGRVRALSGQLQKTSLRKRHLTTPKGRKEAVIQIAERSRSGRRDSSAEVEVGCGREHTHGTGSVTGHWLSNGGWREKKVEGRDRSDLAGFSDLGILNVEPDTVKRYLNKGVA